MPRKQLQQQSLWTLQVRWPNPLSSSLFHFLLLWQIEEKLFSLQGSNKHTKPNDTTIFHEIINFLIERNITKAGLKFLSTLFDEPAHKTISKAQLASQLGCLISTTTNYSNCVWSRMLLNTSTLKGMHLCVWAFEGHVHSKWPSLQFCFVPHCRCMAGIFGQVVLKCIRKKGQK